MTVDPVRLGGTALKTLRNGNPIGDPSTAPRCGARTRRGTPCQGPAVRGRRRCRMHGGTNPGPPAGNKNGWKHGQRSAAAVAERKERVIRSRNICSGLAAALQGSRLEEGE